MVEVNDVLANLEDNQPDSNSFDVDSVLANLEDSPQQPQRETVKPAVQDRLSSAMAAVDISDGFSVNAPEPELAYPSMEEVATELVTPQNERQYQSPDDMIEEVRPEWEYSAPVQAGFKPEHLEKMIPLSHIAKENTGGELQQAIARLSDNNLYDNMTVSTGEIDGIYSPTFSPGGPRFKRRPLNDKERGDQMAKDIRLVQQYFDKPRQYSDTVTQGFTPEQIQQWELDGEIGAVEGVENMTDKDWLEKVPLAGMVFSLKHSGELMSAVDRLSEPNRYDEMTVNSGRHENTGYNPYYAGGRMSVPVKRKMTEDEQLAQMEKDIDLISEYLEKRAELEVRGTTLGNDVLQGIFEMPDFLATFMASGPAGAIVKKGVGKTVLNAAVKKLGKKAVVKLLKKKGIMAGLKAAGSMLDAGGRMAVQAPEIVSNAITDNIDSGEYNLTEHGLDIFKDREKMSSSLIRSIGDMYIENLSELSGPALSKVGGKITGKIGDFIEYHDLPGGKLGRKFLQKLEKMYKSKFPEGDFAELMRDKMKFGGFVEEYSEEVWGDFLRGVFNVEDFGAGENSDMGDRLSGFASQQTDMRQILTTAGVLAAPGGVRHAASLLQNRHKNRLDDKAVDKSLERQDKLSGHVYQGMSETESDYQIYENAGHMNNAKATRDNNTERIMAPLNNRIQMRDMGMGLKKGTITTRNQKTALGVAQMYNSAYDDADATIRQIGNGRWQVTVRRSPKISRTEGRGTSTQIDTTGKLMPLDLQLEDFSNENNTINPERGPKQIEAGRSGQDVINSNQPDNQIADNTSVDIGAEGRYDNQHSETTVEGGHQSESWFDDDYEVVYDPSLDKKDIPLEDQFIMSSDTSDWEMLGDLGLELEDIAEGADQNISDRAEAIFMQPKKKQPPKRDITIFQAGSNADGKALEGREQVVDELPESFESNSYELPKPNQIGDVELTEKQMANLQERVNKQKKPMWARLDKSGRPFLTSKRPKKGPFLELEPQKPVKKNKKSKSVSPKAEVQQKANEDYMNRLANEVHTGNITQEQAERSAKTWGKANIDGEDSGLEALEQAVERVGESQDTDPVAAEIKDIEDRIWQYDMQDRQTDAQRKIIRELNDRLRKLKKQQKGDDDETGGSTAKLPDKPDDSGDGVVDQKQKSKSVDTQKSKKVIGKKKKAAKNVKQEPEKNSHIKYDSKLHKLTGNIREDDDYGDFAEAEVVAGPDKGKTIEIPVSMYDKDVKTVNTMLERLRQNTVNVADGQIEDIIEQANKQGRELDVRDVTPYVPGISLRHIEDGSVDKDILPYAYENLRKTFAAFDKLDEFEKTGIKSYTPTTAHGWQITDIAVGDKVCVSGSKTYKTVKKVDHGHNTIVVGNNTMNIDGIVDVKGKKPSGKRLSDKYPDYSDSINEGDIYIHSRFGKPGYYFRGDTPHQINDKWYKTEAEVIEAQREYLKDKGVEQSEPGKVDDAELNQGQKRAKAIAQLELNENGEPYSGHHNESVLKEYSGLKEPSWHEGDKASHEKWIKAADEIGMGKKVRKKLWIAFKDYPKAKQKWLKPLVESVIPEVEETARKNREKNAEFAKKATGYIGQSNSNEKISKKVVKKQSDDYGFGTIDYSLTDDHTGGYYKYQSGKTMKTASGRTTKPVPQIDTSTRQKAKNSQKRINSWLRSEAILEAKSRRDSLNERIYVNEDPKKFAPATLDMIQDYIFNPENASQSGKVDIFKDPNRKPQERTEPWQFTKTEYMKHITVKGDKIYFMGKELTDMLRKAQKKDAENLYKHLVRNAVEDGYTLPPDVAREAEISKTVESTLNNQPATIETFDGVIPDGYHNGNPYKLNGKSEHKFGADWLVADVLDGHLKGKELHIPANRHPDFKPNDNAKKDDVELTDTNVGEPETQPEHNYGEGRAASQEVIFDGAVARWEDDRIRVYFDEKPSEETRSKLKSSGYALKWSPKNKAWQTHYMQQHRWTRIVQYLGTKYKKVGTKTKSEKAGGTFDTTDLETSEIKSLLSQIRDNKAAGKFQWEDTDADKAYQRLGQALEPAIINLEDAQSLGSKFEMLKEKILSRKQYDIIVEEFKRGIPEKIQDTVQQKAKQPASYLPNRIPLTKDNIYDGRIVYDSEHDKYRRLKVHGREKDLYTVTNLGGGVARQQELSNLYGVTPFSDIDNALEQEYKKLNIAFTSATASLSNNMWVKIEETGNVDRAEKINGLIQAISKTNQGEKVWSVTSFDNVRPHIYLSKDEAVRAAFEKLVDGYVIARQNTKSEPSQQQDTQSESINIDNMSEDELATYIASQGMQAQQEEAGIETKMGDKAAEEFHDAIKELGDYLNDKTFGNPIADPKIWQLTGKVTAKAIKAGIFKFSDMIKQVSSMLGDTLTRRISGNLERAWDNLHSVDSSGKMQPRDSEVEKILDSQNKNSDNINRKVRNGTESRIRDRDSIGKTGMGTFEQSLSETSGSSELSRTGSGDQVVRGDGADSGRMDGSGGKRQGKSDAVSAGVRDSEANLDNSSRPGRREPAGRNYRIESGQNVAGRGVKTRAKNNIAAIKLIKKLQNENCLATAEEQGILVKYTGWGDKPQIFDESNKEWSELYQELKDILTEQEYSAARRSTLNAHYTSTEVIEGIWNGLKSLGVSPNRIMEPSMGIGHFYGGLPDTLASADLYGVELDEITGNIAKNLYQNANINVTGYEKVRFPENFFDLHISNVPFGDYKLSDHNVTGRKKYLIHDFFFIKALHNTRPGGLVAFITSKGTLDKMDSTVRQEIANSADLVGAVRLPYTAFKGNAGTEVITDIIILQKREPDQSPAGENFLEIADIEQGIDIFKINEYFQKHPDHILGKLAYTGKMYRGKSLNVEPVKDQEIGQAIADAIGAMFLPVKFNGHVDQKTEELDSLKGKGLAPENIKYDSFTVRDNTVYQNTNGILKPVTKIIKGKEIPLSSKMVERYKQMISVRDTALKLLSEQLDENVTDEKIEQTRKELNQAYDLFVKKFKPFSTNYNAGQFRYDPDYPLLRSLEHYDSETQTAEKAAIFSQRTQRPVKILSKVETAKDGLLACYDKYGKVDINYVSELTGKDTQDLIDELIGLIYKDPATGGYVSAENYLSGNVKKKLKNAIEAAKTDQSYQPNIEALEAVQPEDLEPHDIDVKLGSNWVDPEDYQQFIMQLLDRPEHFDVNIGYSPSGGTWFLTGIKLKNAVETQQWGTSRRNALDIIEACLNQRRIKVYDTVRKEGKDVQILNKEDSLAAQAKQEELDRAFKDWVWADNSRRERLARRYNDLYNNTIFAQYDGSHLTFPGQNIAITLNPHQKNVVWRSLQQGNILLAHATGAGKSFVMAATIMESRRLGLARKPVVVVPNHLVDDFSGQLLTLYPSAKVLRATKKDFTPAKRQTLFNRIRTGDWDAVVVPMSSFEKMPMNPEYTSKIFDDLLDDLEAEIRDAQTSSNDNRSIVKKLENAKEKFKATLEDLEAKHNKDVGPYFDDLGIDKMFVDEAHGYKNLWFKSQKQDIAGINPQYVKRAFDMWLKTQFLNTKTSYKGVVFATATPIANSVTEMYIMQRYLQPQVLTERGVSSFDAWSTNFGKTVVQAEVTPDGAGYRMKERFSQFSNIPELMQMFRSVADIVTSDMLDLPIPKLKGGKHQVIQAPENEYLKHFVSYLLLRAEDMKRGSHDKKKDNMLNIVTDGRKAALDIRLIDNRLPDIPDSKVNICIDKVFSIHEREAEHHALQVIWCDYSSPKSGGEFNLYDDIKGKLIKRGIPKDQIAFIHDAKTEIQLEKLYDKARSGKIRVLIASTGKMGVGANVQRRLVAQHHLDPPWRPADLEQRDGRMLRQGNLYNKWDIPVESYRYASQGSFDAYMWQTLETKAKFIASVMTGRAETRSIDELDNQTMNYAEMKAASAGNPKIMELVTLEAEVAKLYALKKSHQTQKWNAQRDAESYRKSVKNIEKELPDLIKDAQEYNNAVEKAGDNIDITINGKHYTKAKEAGEALTTALADLDNNDMNKLGSYYGFDFSVRKLRDNDFLGVIELHSSHRIELGGSGSGNLVRIKNAMENLNKVIEQKQKVIPAYQQRAEGFDKAAKLPFEDEKKLGEMDDRLSKLKLELSMDDKQGTSKEIKPVPDRNVVIQEMLDMGEMNDDFQKPQAVEYLHETADMGFVNTYLENSELTPKRLAKAFGILQKSISTTDTDGEFIVTLPNGKTIYIDSLASIYKDGRDDYRGLWRNLPGTITLEDGRKIDFDGMIRLSAYFATADTLPHEQFHAAMDLALSDKEKAVILSRFNGDEEWAADIYGAWAAGRDSKGYPFFTKIRDFFRCIFNAITGRQDIGDIFSRIYSGKIWNESAQTTSTWREAPQKAKGRDLKSMVGKGPEGITKRKVKQLGATWGKEHKTTPQERIQIRTDARREYEGKKSARQLTKENAKTAMDKANSGINFITNILEPNRAATKSFGYDTVAEIIKMASAPEAGQLEFGDTMLSNIEMSYRELRDKIENLSAEQKQYIYHIRGEAVSDAGKYLQTIAKDKISREALEYVRMLDEVYDAPFKLLEKHNFDTTYYEDYFYGVYKDSNKARELSNKFLKHYPTTQKMLKHKVIPTVADANGLGLEMRDANPVDNAFREVGAIWRLIAMVQLRDYLVKNHTETGIIHVTDANEYHLQNWRHLYKQQGSNVEEPIFQDYLLHPDLYRPIAALNSFNLTGRDGVRQVRSFIHIMNGFKFLFPMHHCRTIGTQMIVDSGSTLGILKPSTWKKITKYKIDDEIRKSKEYREYVSLGGGHNSSMEIESRQAMKKWIEGELRWHNALLKIPYKVTRATTGRFTDWTFEKFIPGVKYVKYLQEVDTLREKQGYEPTDAQKIEIIKVGQNFYGEMNEKIFGRSPTVTSAMRFAFLAPGFREGNYRTMLRAVDAATLNKLGGPLGRDWRSFRNIPLFLTLSLITAQIASLLLTGEGPEPPEEGENPEEWLRDLFKIRTGITDNKGRPIMLDLMTSDKDYYEQIVSPFIKTITGRPIEGAQKAIYTVTHTIGGMSSPFRGLVNDLDTITQGKVLVDWKGQRIWYESDSGISKLHKFLMHEWHNFEPIPFSAERQMEDKGLGAMERLIATALAMRVSHSDLEKRRSSLWRRFFDMRDKRTELRKMAKESKLPQGEIDKFNNLLDDAMTIMAIPIDLRDYMEGLYLPDLPELLSSINDYELGLLKKKVRAMYLAGKMSKASQLIREYNHKNPGKSISLGQILRKRSA